MSRFQVVRSLLVGLRGLAVVAVLLGSASAIEAQTVITLAWDANTEPDLAGYQVSYGTQSGVYSTIVDVGNVTSRSFTLTSGVVYYFAVKAYNSASPRQYSPYSAEVATGPGTNNRAPTLTQPANQTSSENADISLQLVASDPDDNPLTFSATGLPASLTVNATTGLVSGTLTYTSAGSYTVTATVSDGALTSSRTFAWTVTDVVGATPVTTYGIALGTADFNGDGKPDILWRNAVTGENYVWYMDGATRTGVASLTTVADPNWRIVATADFNGDGKPDLLWRNATRGENLVWFMDGVMRTGGAWLATVSDLNWKIVGTADFDGDGKPDILWRNATTGQNYVWYMNGVTRAGGTFLETVADPNWKIVGTGDLSGDGKPDLLWRNTSTGVNYAWYMNGVTRTGGAFLVTVTDLNWSMAVVADFNGDGKPDVLWRHSVTGENILWYLDGAARVGYEWVLTNADPNWQIGQRQ
jgi:hypothetical protein